MITIRRRKDKAGGSIYQVWPCNLPANAPTPAWQPEADLPDCLAAPIAVAVLAGAFEPLPYDDSEEEAQVSQEEWERTSSPGAEEDVTSSRDHPDWGTW